MKPIRTGSHTVGSPLLPCNRPLLTSNFFSLNKIMETTLRALQKTSHDNRLPQYVTGGLSKGIQLECTDRKVSQEAVPWCNNGTNH